MGLLPGPGRGVGHGVAEPEIGMGYWLVLPHQPLVKYGLITLKGAGPMSSRKRLNSISVYRLPRVFLASRCRLMISR